MCCLLVPSPSRLAHTTCVYAAQRLPPTALDLQRCLPPRCPLPRCPLPRCPLPRCPLPRCPPALRSAFAMAPATCFDPPTRCARTCLHGCWLAPHLPHGPPLPHCTPLLHGSPLPHALPIPLQCAPARPARSWAASMRARACMAVEVKTPATPVKERKADARVCAGSSGGGAGKRPGVRLRCLCERQCCRRFLQCVAPGRNARP